MARTNIGLRKLQSRRESVFVLDTWLQLITVEKQACISIVTAACSLRETQEWNQQCLSNWRWCVGVCADWPGRCMSHRSSPGPAAGTPPDSDPTPDHRQPAGLQPQPASPSHSCWDKHTVIMSRGSLVCTRHLHLKVEQMCRGLLHEQWKNIKVANLLTWQAQWCSDAAYEK